jgi:glycosyltransferase involved in cell wall biosynthesis
MEALISILIPVFNRETLIKETVYSALNQSYSNIEVIIVDNASTDATWKIVTDIARYDKRIKCYKNDKNIGPVRNWEAAINWASGEYGKILWSDDLIEPDFIEKTIPYLKDESVGFVYSKTTVFYEGSELTNELYSLKETGCYSTEQFIQGVIFEGGYPVSPGCALFRMCDLKKNLLVQIPNKVSSDFSLHAIGNDLLIYLLTANDYLKFAYVDESLSLFRAHSGSISISSMPGKLPMHYTLATAYYIENMRPDLIQQFNAKIFGLLIIYKKNNFGLHRIRDFYLINDINSIDFLFFIKKSLKAAFRKLGSTILSWFK